MNKADDYYFEYYLVAYTDILGQKNDLLKMSEIPTDKYEKLGFIETVKNTVRKVEFVRDNFDIFFQTLLAKRPDTTLVPQKYEEQFKASLEIPNIIKYGLSDSFIVALPLSNLNYNQTANGLHSVITAICAMSILSLANKIPIRAGLDVGVACKIYEKEIYGSALAKAYSLESIIAKYPRFVVGEELIMLLKSHERIKCKSIMDEVARGIIRKCSDYIIKDSDGICILDYLGKGIKESFNDGLSNDDVIKAWEFIKSEHDKYVEEGNVKLQLRYSSLINYFKSKQDIWDLDLV